MTKRNPAATSRAIKMPLYLCYFCLSNLSKSFKYYPLLQKEEAGRGA